jgi:predicted metal-dependent hydrolase
MAQLAHPDFFAELDHPGGIADVKLSTMFPPEPDFSWLDVQDIVQTEKKLKEAKQTLESLERTYNDKDCHEVVQSKASLELVGSFASWAQIFLPIAPQTKETITAGVIFGIIGKVASDQGNQIGQSDAYERCVQVERDISGARNRVEAAQERYEAEVKKVFGVYSQRVKQKKQSETHIRDWKNYAYQLELYRHKLNPSLPKPSVPVFAFRNTPVASERVMRMGARTIHQMLT